MCVSDPRRRLSAVEALQSRWITGSSPVPRHTEIQTTPQQLLAPVEIGKFVDFTTYSSAVFIGRVCPVFSSDKLR